MKWHMQKWSVNHKNKMLFCNSSKPNFNATTFNKLIWYPKQKPKNWCFCIVVQGKTLESPLDSKEIQPVNPKGNQPWIVIGRTDAETEAPILWPPDAKSRLIGKGPSARKDWGQEEKGTTQDDSWRTSSTQWTWVWASSGRQWRTMKSGVLQSMGLQTVRQDLATEQQARNHSLPLGNPTIHSLFVLMDSTTLLNLSKFMSHVYNQIINSMKSAAIPTLWLFLHPIKVSRVWSL